MIPLPNGKPAFASREAWFDEMGDCKIDVIAPEQDVVADGNPGDPGVPAAFILAELKQAEIRSAAPDVDHQNVAYAGLRIWQRAPRIGAVGLLLQPAVERRLRLLEQTHVIGEAGLLGGGKRQPLCRRVKGSRNGDCNVLGVERETRALPCKAGVPCRAKMSKNERRCVNGRDFVLLRQRIRSPGQEWRRAVGGVMTEPGLRGFRDTPWCFAGLALGQTAYDPITRSGTTAPDLRGDRLLRQVKERWNRRGFRHR